MAISSEQSFTPTEAREMHGGISPNEEVVLHPTLTFFLASIFKKNTDVEIDAAQPLLAEVEQEAMIVKDAVEEQTIARTLLFRFGLPYLPGAEEVWLIISEYLVAAKEATKKAESRLEQAIEQIKALLISQLTVDQEAELKALETEEEQHLHGKAILQRTDAALVEESELLTQKDDAIGQKKKRLNAISIQKGIIKNSIESMRAMVSNLILSFTGINQLDSTQLVMA